MIAYLAQQDPFRPYDAAKKPRPVVPESEVYGGLLIATMVVAMWMRRAKR